jgi:hypothetical protein
LVKRVCLPAGLVANRCPVIDPHMRPGYVAVRNPEIRRDAAPDDDRSTSQSDLASCVRPTDNPQARLVAQACLARDHRRPGCSARRRAPS